GGIRGYDRAGTAVSGDLLQQATFDGETFGHDFDDPIGLGAPGEVVFEIADSDAVRGSGSKKCGRACFLCGFEAGADDAIADTRVGERQTAGFLLGGELGGGDVKQPAVDP